MKTPLTEKNKFCIGKSRMWVVRAEFARSLEEKLAAAEGRLCRWKKRDEYFDTRCGYIFSGVPATFCPNCGGKIIEEGKE